MMPAPMPRELPVTRATLPEKSNASFIVATEYALLSPALSSLGGKRGRRFRSANQPFNPSTIQRCNVSAASAGVGLRRQCRLRLGLRLLRPARDLVRGRQAHQHLRRDVAGLGEFDQAFLAFGQGLVRVAFLAEAALGLLAALPEHGINIAAE